VENEQEQSLRERLNKMFTRWNYVGVRNILSVPFEWKVALEQNELIGMSPGGMNEDEMLKQKGGAFLPSDAVVRGKTKVVPYTLQPGEKKMIIGEAAYVIIDKIFRMYVKEKYVPAADPQTPPTTFEAQRRKAGLAKLRNPLEQDRILKMILVGPIINNVEAAVQTFAQEQMNKLEGFTDVQTSPSELDKPEPQRGKTKETAKA
jgi:hypothetical protein